MNHTQSRIGMAAILAAFMALTVHYGSRLNDQSVAKTFGEGGIVGSGSSSLDTILPSIPGSNIAQTTAGAYEAMLAVGGKAVEYGGRLVLG